MKRTIQMASICLICVLLLVGGVFAVDVSSPAWERYAPLGGQLDDTAYEDVLAWLLIPGNREAAQPDASGGEVLASVIVENARSLVGKYPYVYGGESPEEGGFDCTGLVWYVYNQMSGLDITLSQAGRSKAALAAAGEQIYDHDAFLPGDVIQFTYAHVAIYVGDGRVVHARTTGTMIQETDLNYNNVEYAVRYPGVVQSDILVSGEYGDTLSWVLRRNGELTVSGAGEMPEPAAETDVPWHDYRDRITSAVLEETVTNVSAYAFYECENLADISAPGVTAVGLAAFYNCAALTEAEFSGLTAVARLGFSGCAALNGITLSEGIGSIAYGAFRGCAALTEIVIPATVTEIGDLAFEKCVSLQSITLPDGVTAIGESAFFGCKALETASLGASLASIGDCAFYGCESLYSVELPKTLTHIGDWAFGGCDAMTDVTYSGTVTEWEKVEIGSDNDPLLEAKLLCTGKPDTPDLALTLDADDTPVLTWGPLANAERYEIWRAGEDGFFDLVGETEDCVYYDLTADSENSYFYMVRAVSGEAEGKFSNIVVIHRIRRYAGVPPRP